MTLAAFSSWNETVPIATRHLFVTVDSPTDVLLSLLDPVTLWPIGTPYKGVPVMVNGETGEPTHREIKLSGSSPNDLILKVTNNADSPTTVKIGYVYDYYTSEAVSAQCQLDAQPFGCLQFDQYHVRDTVSNWACWLNSQFDTPDVAWNILAQPEVEGSGVPAYRWCAVWRKWHASSTYDVSCMASYKFVTQGGEELGLHSVYKTNFEWAFRSCAIRQFFSSCCQVMASQYTSPQDAWVHWTANMPGMHTLDPLGPSPWEACLHQRPAGISKLDVFKFLDADGYGGVRLADIGFCWEGQHADRFAADMPTFPPPVMPQPVMATLPPLLVHRQVAIRPTLSPLLEGQKTASMLTGAAAGIAGAVAAAGTPGFFGARVAAPSYADQDFSTRAAAPDEGAAPADFSQWLSAGGFSTMLAVICLSFLLGLVAVLCLQTGTEGDLENENQFEFADTDDSDGEAVPLLSERFSERSHRKVSQRAPVRSAGHIVEELQQPGQSLPHSLTVSTSAPLEPSASLQPESLVELQPQPESSIELRQPQLPELIPLELPQRLPVLDVSLLPPTDPQQSLLSPAE